MVLTDLEEIFKLPEVEVETPFAELCRDVELIVDQPKSVR